VVRLSCVGPLPFPLHNFDILKPLSLESEASENE
jgi:hypothetical protein